PTPLPPRSTLFPYTTLFRSLLVEVHVPNPEGLLLPGMYAQVGLSSARSVPPLLVPSDALIIQADGTTVALLRPDHTVHLQKIERSEEHTSELQSRGHLVCRL